MQRRDCFLALAALGLTQALDAFAADAKGGAGPRFFSFNRGKARVFLFGFGEAKDESWLTANIQRAFRESSSLWLETGREKPAQDPAIVAARIEELSHETGRSFFDVLEPSLRERTKACMTDLGIKEESVATLRPWRAYYVIVSAFFSKRQTQQTQVAQPDAVFWKLATDAHKSVGYEMPTYLSFVEYMAKMPDTAQSQYVEWLLDFRDDIQSGRHPEFDDAWIHGNFATAQSSLDRMRTQMPALYRIMQLQRNEWWARKVDALLHSGDTHFIAVGNLHAMGPDGIPAQVERLKIAKAVRLSV